MFICLWNGGDISLFIWWGWGSTHTKDRKSSYLSLLCYGLNSSLNFYKSLMIILLFLVSLYICRLAVPSALMLTFVPFTDKSLNGLFHLWHREPESVSFKNKLKCFLCSSVHVTWAFTQNSAQNWWKASSLHNILSSYISGSAGDFKLSSLCGYFHTNSGFHP